MKKHNDFPLEIILEKIMTVQEYSGIQYSKPYIFILNSRDKNLYYFGSPHVRDPKSLIFSEIENSFNDANPDIVFVEGINTDDKSKFDERVKNADRDEIIDKMGESGFTLKLAIEKDVPWHCPEPTDEDLYRNLLENNFLEDEIFAWSVFQILPQYHRQINKKGFELYSKVFIEKFKIATRWEDFNYSYDRAIQIGQDILGRLVDVENESKSIDFIDPIPRNGKTQTVLNHISQSASIFRNKKIVSDVLEALKNYNNIFVVYGSSHAVMQEPAFKEFFGRLE